MQATSVIKVDRTHIPSVPFKKDEVLMNHDEKSLRMQDLTRAMSLGNLFKESVRIQFVNSTGEPMETEATIWSVTEKNVLLKGGVTIPIHAIAKVVL